jgi:transcriptional regulator with GAF, ATPase, and Fis domain
MRSRSVGNDSEILSAPMLETRCETLVHVSQAIAAHGDPKELFSVLANELHRVVQFDFIGVSLRDKNSDTFQNYFIDMASRSELLPEEKLAPDETLTQWVYERQQEQAVASSQESLQLFTNRYKGGVDTYLQVITAQTIELANERNAIDIERRRLDASVLLIKALGGGWNVSNLPTFGASRVRDF